MKWIDLLFIFKIKIYFFVNFKCVLDFSLLLGINLITISFFELV